MRSGVNHLSGVFDRVECRDARGPGGVEISARRKAAVELKHGHAMGKCPDGTRQLRVPGEVEQDEDDGRHPHGDGGRAAKPPQDLDQHGLAVREQEAVQLLRAAVGHRVGDVVG